MFSVSASQASLARLSRHFAALSSALPPGPGAVAGAGDAASGFTVNIIGASSRLVAAGPGAPNPQVTAVVSARFPIAQEGIHHFCVNVVDLNGHAVSPPAEGTAKLEAKGDDVYAWMRLAITFTSRKFTEPGDFRFDLEIDGELVASSWLCVVRN